MLCHYASFAEVVNQALGDGSKAEERVDITANAPTFEAAIAAINSAWTIG